MRPNETLWLQGVELSGMSRPRVRVFYVGKSTLEGYVRVRIASSGKTVQVRQSDLYKTSM